MISRIQGSIRVFLQVMQTKGIMKTEPTLKTRSPINDFLQGLAEDRGLHAKTIGQYRNSLNQFLQHIEFDDSAGEMLKLTTKDIDKFIVYAGRKYGRSSMRAICTALRGLLRYLHESSLLPHDLSLTVTMPMFYALERLPCAVPWKIINSLLEFPNKKTDAGKRDHAILQLLIAYGIRPGELVRLHLVDVNWRREQICFSRSKPGRVLRFPLTRDVGEAILSYLRNGRPTTSQSNLFMTARAPYVPLSAKAVYSIVQKYVEKAGIDARIKGPYLIRHSLAVNLIRQGQPLKTITDILGHRDPHVAYHYTKLATEDLRDVALSVKEVLP